MIAIHARLPIQMMSAKSMASKIFLYHVIAAGDPLKRASGRHKYGVFESEVEAMSERELSEVQRHLSTLIEATMDATGVILYARGRTQ